MLRYAICTLLCLPFTLHAQAGRVERLTRGDTTIVRTAGNGIWGPVHDATEVLRIGGNSKESTFGKVSRVVALPSGGVLVFDEKGLEGRALRSFDRDGKFVQTIGREGDGPGEYRALAPFITVGADGGVLLRQLNGLVNRYHPDGSFSNAFRIEMGAGGMLDVFAAPGKSIYIRSGRQMGAPDPLASITELVMRRYDTLGVILDSIKVPSYVTIRSQSPFAPHDWWIPLPDGRAIVTRTDRLGFLIRSGVGLRTLFLADVVAEGPLFLPEERREQQTLMDFQHEQMGKALEGGYPAFTVPERKLLTGGGAILSTDGRIWIRRTATGVKGVPFVAASYSLKGGEHGSIKISYRDRPVYSAFQVDGTYLGDVRFPPGVTMIAFGGDYAWAVVPGADDEPMLVKYRIAPAH